MECISLKIIKTIFIRYANFVSEVNTADRKPADSSLHVVDAA